MVFRFEIKQPWKEVLGCVGWQEAQHKLATCVQSPESQICINVLLLCISVPNVSWAASKAAWTEGGRSPVSTSGAPNIWRTQTCCSESREGHEDALRAGAALLWKQAESWGCSVWRRIRGGLRALSSTYKGAGEGIFKRACGKRQGGNGFKLKESRFNLHIGKEWFSVKVMRHWHKLLIETLDASSLEVLKARLDVLGRIWSSKRCPCTQQGVELDDLYNPRDSVIPWNKQVST